MTGSNSIVEALKGNLLVQQEATSSGRQTERHRVMRATTGHMDNLKHIKLRVSMLAEKLSGTPEFHDAEHLAEFLDVTINGLKKGIGYE